MLSRYCAYCSALLGSAGLCWCSRHPDRAGCAPSLIAFHPDHPLTPSLASPARTRARALPLPSSLCPASPGRALLRRPRAAYTRSGTSVSTPALLFSAVRHRFHRTPTASSLSPSNIPRPSYPRSHPPLSSRAALALAPPAAPAHTPTPTRAHAHVHLPRTPQPRHCHRRAILKASHISSSSPRSHHLDQRVNDARSLPLSPLLARLHAVTCSEQSAGTNSEQRAQVTSPFAKPKQAPHCSTP